MGCSSTSTATCSPLPADVHTGWTRDRSSLRALPSRRTRLVAVVPEISHAMTAPSGWQKLCSQASSGFFGMAWTATRDDLWSTWPGWRKSSVGGVRRARS